MSSPSQLDPPVALPFSYTGFHVDAFGLRGLLWFFLALHPGSFYSPTSSPSRRLSLRLLLAYDVLLVPFCSHTNTFSLSGSPCLPLPASPALPVFFLPFALPSSVLFLLLVLSRPSQHCASCGSRSRLWTASEGSSSRCTPMSAFCFSPVSAARATSSQAWVLL